MINTFFNISRRHGLAYALRLALLKITAFTSQKHKHVWPLPRKFRLGPDQHQALLDVGQPGPKIASQPDRNDHQHRGHDHPTLGRLGVHVHVHYSEQLEEIARHLYCVPWNIDLFVSTHNTYKATLCSQILGDLPNVTKLDIQVTDNKGRDIAPMVLTFGPLLESYECALHLHSKVSPYGDITQGWRDHLYNSVLASSQQVDRILNQFAKEPRLGLVSPPGFAPLMPYTHWANNHIIASRLLTSWGLDTKVFNSPLLFPAGSFFWFRPKALKPLLVDHQLNWDSFPPEPLPNDNTICHAIERLFGALPTALGYKVSVSHQIPEGLRVIENAMDVFEKANVLCLDSPQQSMTHHWRKRWKQHKTRHEAPSVLVRYLPDHASLAYLSWLKGQANSIWVPSKILTALY